MRQQLVNLTCTLRRQARQHISEIRIRIVSTLRAEWIKPMVGALRLPLCQPPGQPHEGAGA